LPTAMLSWRQRSGASLGADLEAARIHRNVDLELLDCPPKSRVVQAARQQVTLAWWAQREEFALFVADPVLAEVGRGDPAAAKRRLEAAQGIAVLSSVKEAEALAAALIAEAAMPPKAIADAAHVALAAVHELDFLLTWNCTHIANAAMRPRIEAVCRNAGFQAPIICTPDELSPKEES
jgi:hypothetical protein